MLNDPGNSRRPQEMALAACNRSAISVRIGVYLLLFGLGAFLLLVGPHSLAADSKCEELTFSFINKVKRDRQKLAHLFHSCQGGDARDFYQIVGEVRLSEAADKLASDIEYFRKRDISESALSSSPLRGFPAARSLTVLGDPGVRAILKDFRGELSREKLKLSTWVIHLVERECAEERLRMAKDVEIVEESARRLVRNVDRALRYLHEIELNGQNMHPHAQRQE